MLSGSYGFSSKESKISTIRAASEKRFEAPAGSILEITGRRLQVIAESHDKVLKVLVVQTGNRWDVYR